MGSASHDLTGSVTGSRPQKAKSLPLAHTSCKPVRGLCVMGMLLFHFVIACPEAEVPLVSP